MNGKLFNFVVISFTLKLELGRVSAVLTRRHWNSVVPWWLWKWELVRTGIIGGNIYCPDKETELAPSQETDDPSWLRSAACASGTSLKIIAVLKIS